MRRIMAIALILGIYRISLATVINIPADYPTIQQGIDASVNGDTVLVQPGTYVENINFNGHNIVLGSLFLTTRDTSYISQTEIDGDNSGSVVIFESGEDSTTLLTGFTIKNGSSSYGGGVRCDSSSPGLTYLIIRDNSVFGYSNGDGGGIYCNNSSPHIANSIITENRASSFIGGGSGAGISCYYYSDAVLSNVLICDNRSYAGGGGIFSYYSKINIIGCTITGNSAGWGGGIAIGNYDSLTIINSIIWGNVCVDDSLEIDGNGSFTVSYSDIRGGWSGMGNINENPLFVDQLNFNYNVCLQSPCIDAGDPTMYDPDSTRADMGMFFPDHPACFQGDIWHVSVDGNDTTGNGSLQHPFRTIQHGVNTALHGDTILVLNGTYEENVVIKAKNIVLASNYIHSLQNEDIENTVIAGQSDTVLVRTECCDISCMITGLTFSNGNGSGIQCKSSGPLIKSNLIVSSSGAGILCDCFSYPHIIGNTLNSNSNYGIRCYNSSPLVQNSILWGNSPQEIYTDDGSSPDIIYCDVMGGWNGTGNIPDDPLFVDPFNHNYNICSGSPCIDAGNPGVIDPDGSISDIGIFYWNHPQCDIGRCWYVSVTGDDFNGNGNFDNPFRTIQRGIDASHGLDTVIVENGTYEENIFLFGRSITVSSNHLFTLDPNDVQNTIIDGEGITSAVTIQNCGSDLNLNGLTIKNGYNYDRGGGIKLINSDCVLTNNIICENSAAYYGAGISCRESNPLIRNNIITGNIVPDTWYSTTDCGGGIHIYSNSYPQLINNIIYANSSPEIYCSDSLLISYCVVNGDYGGVGNIDADPLFSELYNDIYNVCLQSPCIDAGDPSLLDPDSTRSDIGLFYPNHTDCDIGKSIYVSTTGNDTTGTGTPQNPYRSVQHSIDVSYSSDSIIVDNGIYVENIELYGKNILLASNYMQTGDFEDILTTILDGDSSGSVISMDGCDSTTIIMGFTITNGFSINGAGINCSYSKPLIKHSFIRNNRTFTHDYARGGGIRCKRSNITIIQTVIEENNGNAGGGFYCDYGSEPSIVNTVISRNIGEAGGGFYGAYGSEATIKNSIIWNNDSSNIAGDSLNITYSDIFGGWEGEGNINIIPMFVNSYEDDYNLCSESPCIDAGDPSILDPDGTRSDMGVFFADHPVCSIGRAWYVSVAGNDTTGDGSEGNPFRTIQHGINNATHNDTVIVESGTYVENITFRDNNIILASRFLTSGDTSYISSTIIDGDSSGIVVTIENGQDSTTRIVGFTIRNGLGGSLTGGIYCYYSSPTIKNNNICNNRSSGIKLYGSGALIENNIIRDNRSSGVYCITGSNNAIISKNLISQNGENAHNGGGINIYSSAVTAENNIITANRSDIYGGGIHCNNSDSKIINNVIFGNSAQYGGGIYITLALGLTVKNNICWGDSAYTAGNEIWPGYNSAVTYCDVQGGYWGATNIDVDPLFRDWQIGDFHLMSVACGDTLDSPCIDAGDPSIWDEILNCEFGLGDSVSDMGAYGGGMEIQTGISENQIELPREFSLKQNYPNPFNSSTIIRYDLPKGCNVTIDIYDILGRKVDRPIDGWQPAGYFNMVWNGGDFSSGIYFYRIQAGDYISSRKMLLVK